MKTAAALIFTILFFPVVLALGKDSEAAKAKPPTLEQRIERLTRKMEQRRKDLHIPGMALAVVKDDKVILARGFGFADAEKKISVTPETVFAVGSTTKAFTSTLIGMLVDDGKMTWDDPVSRHLPYFKLRIDTDDEKAKVTIRDTLCHRTGFTRMGILWAGGRVSREKILRTAVKAEPWAPFREKFYYNNVTYLAAGEAAGAAAGSDWDSLIVERIFTPLGMKSSNTTFEKAKSDSRLSIGYQDGAKLKTIPMRKLNGIGPAGSINSNVLDMAKWVRFLLAGGVVDGKRLISERQLAETRKKQINIGGGVDYGLGWMLHDIEGRKLVEHGGNIDGYSAQVGLFVDDNLGFVLLANVTMTPLQAMSNQVVGEMLLGEWSDTEERKGDDPSPAGKAIEFQPYLGKYEANFGPFKDKFFTVQIKNKRLAVDVPGQTVYELKQPDDKGKWYFTITDQIAVSFERDESGKVMTMTMYQAGLEFELPKAGVKRKAEIDPAEANKYFGSYKYSDKTSFKVLLANGRLAVEIPGKLTSGLHPPDKEGKWKLRAIGDRSVKFKLSADGKNAVAMTLYREGREPKEMPRVDEGGTPDTPVIPTLEAVLALRKVESRGPAMDKLKSLRMQGTVRFAQAGVEGSMAVLVGGADRFAVKMNFGEFGYQSLIVNGDQGRMDSNIQPAEVMSAEYLAQVRLQHPAALFGDWRKYYPKIDVLKSDELDGHKVLVVRLSPDGAPAITAYVDAKTGDLWRTETEIVAPGMESLKIPMTTDYNDHREVEGIRIPWKAKSSNEMVGRIVSVWKKIETDVEFDESEFDVKERRSLPRLINELRRADERIDLFPQTDILPSHRYQAGLAQVFSRDSLVVSGR